MPRQPEATRRGVVAGLAAAGSLVARGLPVRAQGNPDMLARLIGQKLTERLGQSVVVENKPGAGALIATQPWPRPWQTATHCCWEQLAP
jgi:hypothetical protein